LYASGDPVPFDIIAGTSAGAMSAAYLATQMPDYRKASAALAALWSALRVKDVYSSDYRKIFAVVARWLWAFVSGGAGESNPRSLLDNGPLRKLLDENLEFSAIQRNIDAGLLRGLTITIAGYSSERSLTYFQAAPDVEPWWRERREGRPVMMTLDHIMASLALPIVFPAVRVDGEWCGDGSTRQYAPLSPAIHLGAERLLILDTHYHKPRSVAAGARPATYPTLSRIGGYLLDTVFSDSLSADLERAERVNRMLAQIPAGAIPLGAPSFRPLETLIIAPSRGPGAIAAHHIGTLPKGIRWMLRSFGGEKEGGDLLLSFMLFEADYCRELIELGRHDARSRADELRRFLGIRSTVVVSAPANLHPPAASDTLQARRAP
ncbi:MAG TPA: patatin-like phospholipase family protein, partial [Gammaproteobacteria bacterium]|nr:patatin-like phospholipase family protein [Gammaproteobacteria bacterium]